MEPDPQEKRARVFLWTGISIAFAGLVVGVLSVVVSILGAGRAIEAETVPTPTSLHRYVTWQVVGLTVCFLLCALGVGLSIAGFMKMPRRDPFDRGPWK